MFRIVIKYHSHKFDEYQSKSYDDAITKALEAIKNDYGHSAIIDVYVNSHFKKAFLIKRHSRFLSITLLTRKRKTECYQKNTAKSTKRGF